MAYKTWAVGDVLTAADMNAMVRDQVITICTSSTRPGGTPATGKFIYETDTGQIRVYNGSSWLLLHMANPPAWEMSGGNGQLIGSGGSGTVYAAGTTVENTGLTAYARSPNSVTIAIPGRYVVSAGVRFDFNGNLFRREVNIQITRSASAYRRITNSSIGSAAVGTGVSTGDDIRLAAGDVLQAVFYQDSGGNLHSDDSLNELHFSGHWVGP